MSIDTDFKLRFCQEPKPIWINYSNCNNILFFTLHCFKSSKDKNSFVNHRIGCLITF